MKNRERNYREMRDLWHRKAVADPDLIPELEAMDAARMQDAFWTDLEFGTAGLRGVIGAGTNRMNVYTVALATQGLADYLRAETPGNPSAVIGYDTRHKSDLFARTAAEVLAANGVKVYLYNRPLPVPTVSFGVRELGASAGIMITASHNPSIYNGYKVYGDDGCQLREEGSAAVAVRMDATDIFEGVKHCDFAAARAREDIVPVPETVLDAFLARNKASSVLGPEDKTDRNVAIVYTPLNGTGLEPVTRLLRECGYTNVTLVEEQKNPDGDFPTCSYPNPELKETLALGMEYAKRCNSDLLIATDPDCDRVGIAVRRQADGVYELLTGNQVGILLLDFLASRRAARGTLTKDAFFVKTIVTAGLCERIGKARGVRCVDVLTGFKYIGEKITAEAEKGTEDNYVLGFEESYGYLAGTHARDKDGVNGVFHICEMFSWYKARGIGLWERLQALYEEFGYAINATLSFAYPGADGFARMAEIMRNLRRGREEIAGISVEKCEDYAPGIYGLPKADVLVFRLTDGSKVTVRPSGTEPKLKVYIEVLGQTENAAETLLEALKAGISALL